MRMRMIGWSAKQTRRNRELVAALFLLAVVAVIALTGGEPSQAHGAQAASEASNANPLVPPGRELEGDRTATSDTYALPDGAHLVRAFSLPINYHAANGVWLPIEEDLEAAPGGGITNGANSFDLHLPTELGVGAVRLSNEEGWLSYKLLGEETDSAAVEGATAEYEADNGSSFELESLAGGLKERITLNDADAPSVFRFSLAVSRGLEPHIEPDGSISVVDENGDLFATLPAPTVSDATGAYEAGAVRYQLQDASEGTWLLSVVADEAWLSRPERAWPVTIDPSAFVASELDCTINSLPAPAGSGQCGASGTTELSASYNQSEKRTTRTFLQFKLGSLGSPVIPVNAYIKNSVLKLYSSKAAENTVPGLETKRVTRSWTSKLNWERFKEHSLLELPENYKWTTPGGDFTSEGLAQVKTAQRGSGLGWWEFSSLNLRELTQAWIEHNKIIGGGGVANQGLVVKQMDETRTSECESKGVCPRRYVGFNSSAATSNKPELDITYFEKAPTSNTLTSPKEGTMSARRLMLKTAWAPGVTGVRYQYRASKTGPFSDIPVSLLRNADGEPVEVLAVAESCCESVPLYFDAAHVNSGIESKGGVLQVRALFEGGAGAGYSEPVETKIDRYRGGPKDAVTSVGPGTLDLLTGNLNLSSNDFSIGGYNHLTFERSYNTRAPGTIGEPTVLGQGWTSGAEGSGGSGWQSIILSTEAEVIEGESYTFEYATLKGITGASISFEKNGETYTAPPEASGNLLVFSEGKYIYTDPDGNKTTFSNEGSGSPNVYLPVSVTVPGASGSAPVATWNFVGGAHRLVRVVAPSASRSSTECAEHPTTLEGCHTLEFTYVTAKEWGAPTTYGERLQTITYYAPGEGGPWQVAAYSYDTQGRLVAEWDPRISPKLETTYSYEGEKLKHITPPGQEPWTLEYAANMDGELGLVPRLKAASRSNLQSGQITTSVRYGVPLTGTSAPYAMGNTEVGEWGQTDLPTDATAVFPPTQVPAESPINYEKATVYYIDPEGFNVNVASPAGAGRGVSISTTEANQYGDVVRELTAQNRLRVLEQPLEERKKLSHLLETKLTYSPNGTELEDELGPLHPVKLQEGGKVEEARLHRTVAYANPEGLNPPPLLPTKETRGAVIPGKGGEVDERINESSYNWSLRAPTEQVTDVGVGHLNIKHKTSYTLNGLVAETRQPIASEESGAVPGATTTVYYGGGLEEPCLFHVKWAGLPCEVKPAAQPFSEGQQIPVTWYKAYSPLGQPTEIVEERPLTVAEIFAGKKAETIRTVITYDEAGRETSKKITGGGQAVEKVQTAYDPGTGLLTTQQFVCESGECTGFDSQATTTTYDKLGRIEYYEDADGNKAKTTYDSYGRPSIISDPEGSETFHYEPITACEPKSPTRQLARSRPAITPTDRSSNKVCRMGSLLNQPILRPTRSLASRIRRA
jgi:YD repeat-containing protein